jgi:hypothetical protein
VIEKSYDHDFEETAAAWDELPRLRAYPEAVGADQGLDEKAKLVRIQAILFGPHGQKSRRTETDHPKAGSEPKNVRLCSLMFAYVRLCSLNGEKIVEAQPAESSGQSSLIKAKLFLNPIESAS